MAELEIVSHHPHFYAACHQFSVGDSYRSRYAQWQLGMTLEGLCHYRFKGGDLWARPGDLHISRAGADYNWRIPAEAGAAGWRCVYTVFYPRSHWLPWLTLPETVPGCSVFHLAGTPFQAIARRQLMTICRMRESNIALHDEWAMLTIERLLILLQGRGEEKHSDPRALRAMEILRGQYSRAWAIDELARICRVSASYLTFLMQQETGMTPIQYLEEVRMQKAREMLALGHWSVAQIAQAVGYNYGSYFARRFRQATGQSPLDYRKTVRTSAAPG